MDYELISAQDYDDLPEDPEQKFVALEQICRRNMTEMIDSDTSGNFDTMVRLQYMATVAAAAQELQIAGVEFPNNDDPMGEYTSFLLKASGGVTGIRLRSPTKAKEYSVLLASRTRGRIELQIQKLRDIIAGGDLPDDKRAALLRRLDELSLELTQSRVSFAKTMAILAYVSLGVVNGTTFLADAPHAVATIASLLGQDKKAEEDEARRLGPPPKPKSLPAPANPQPFGTSNREERSLKVLDDDIPF